MNRTIVTIHGTGRTALDFGTVQAQAIAQHLDTLPHHHSVWWGDLMDAGARAAQWGTWLNARIHSTAQHWLGRPARHTPRIVSATADGLHRFINGVNGVTAYFLPASPKRHAIQNRLRQTLDDLTRTNHEIVLISESLGCLVAFDVLRADAHRYNIAAWVTLGCPLRTIVKTRQRRADLGAINSQTVGQWLNLYAPRDLIAAPIASVFPAYPIRDEIITGGLGRLESHHYWNNPRVAELIAQVIRG